MNSARYKHALAFFIGACLTLTLLACWSPKRDGVITLTSEVDKACKCVDEACARRALGPLQAAFTAMRGKRIRNEDVPIVEVASRRVISCLLPKGLTRAEIASVFSGYMLSSASVAPPDSPPEAAKK